MLIFYRVNVLLHITLIGSLKDKQSQKRDNNLSWETLLGKKTQQNFFYYRFNQVQCQDEDLSPRRIELTDIAPSITNR